jgi:phosphoribosylformylglycinamidine cyclo-ligase
MANEKQKKKITYADAGVDIAAGDEAVNRIKKLAKATFNSQVLTEIGSFGGFFRPKLQGVESPVLISSADGVGTKLKLAFMTGKHNTVGEDLVNHCVNDILVHGARALFFMDYIATGDLDPAVIAEVVSGLSRGCQNAGMALLGGETAEMPDFYQPGEYDLAGFVVGLVDENKIINGSTIKPGDICVGLSSNGLHTNGYTLARKVAFEIAGKKPEDEIADLGSSVGEALMAVHRCYAPVVHRLLESHPIRGMAHITGGGIRGNLNRILPGDCDAVISKGSWPVPAIFEWLQAVGDIDESDIYSAFNMGIGFVLVVEPDVVDAVVNDLQGFGEPAYRIGEIVDGSGTVRLTD